MRIQSTFKRILRRNTCHRLKMGTSITSRDFSKIRYLPNRIKHNLKYMILAMIAKETILKIWNSLSKSSPDSSLLKMILSINNTSKNKRKELLWKLWNMTWKRNWKRKIDRGKYLLLKSTRKYQKSCTLIISWIKQQLRREAKRESFSSQRQATYK